MNYPERKIDWPTLMWMRSTEQLDVVSWLVKTFRERYNKNRFALAIRCGDMALVEKYAPVTCLLRLQGKRCLRTAACYGHVNMLQWLYHQLDGYLPARILWSGLRSGHVDVVCWIMEQRPELLTSERLVEMHQVSLKQTQSNLSEQGDMLRVTRWIEEQKQQLSAQ